MRFPTTWYVYQQKFRSACACTQSDQNLCKSLEYSKTVKLLTEQHLEFLCLKGGYTGMSEYTVVKMPHCWKSHVATHICNYTLLSRGLNVPRGRIITKNIIKSLDVMNQYFVS